VAGTWESFTPGHRISPAKERELPDKPYRSKKGFKIFLYSEALISPTEATVKVNLALLNRIRLHRLQYRLVTEAVEFKFGS
jgi:hypothetical protein